MGIINKQTVQDIADAIRDRNGQTTTYKPREMASAIQGLYKTSKVEHAFDGITPVYTEEGTSFAITKADENYPGSITSLEGNTTQNGTPTPTSPIEVQTVSGDNEVVVSDEQHVTGNSYRVDLGGKNLFDIEASVVGITLVDGTFSSAVTSWITSDFIKIDLDTKYNFNWQPVVTGTYWQTRVIYYDTSKQWVSGTDLSSYPSNYNITITTPSSGVAYMKLSFTNTGNYERTDIQLEKRNSSNRVQSLCKQPYRTM